MDFLDELKLLLVTKGLTPEVLAKVDEVAGDLHRLVVTAADRNVAQAVAAYVQAATMLGGLAEKARAAGNEERAETLATLVLQALSNAADLLDSEGEIEEHPTDEA